MAARALLQSRISRDRYESPASSRRQFDDVAVNRTSDRDPPSTSRRSTCKVAENYNEKMCANKLSTCLIGLACAALTGCQGSPKSAVTRRPSQQSLFELKSDRQLRSEIEQEIVELELDQNQAQSQLPPQSQFTAQLTVQTQALPTQDTVVSTVAPSASPPASPMTTVSSQSSTATPDSSLTLEATSPAASPAREPLKKLKVLESSGIELSSSAETPLIFDLPVTYNARVRTWIRYFQTEGRITFRNWLERSSRFLPVLQYELSRARLPQDLVYVPMIESGFSPNAASPAGAVGMWQFIPETGRRYGLRVDWWLDERKDFHKATQAAIRYMSDLYRQFGSWYLVTASYNMGENGVRRLVNRYQTRNFWELSERGALPQETSDYLPKIIAAMLIAKAPALYGFRDLNYQMPLSFESIMVPGGTDIVNLASYLGVSGKYLKELNPELIKGFIPRTVRSHKIRVPKGSMLAVGHFVRMQAQYNLETRTANE